MTKSRAKWRNLKSCVHGYHIFITQLKHKLTNTFHYKSFWLYICTPHYGVHTLLLAHRAWGTYKHPNYSTTDSHHGVLILSQYYKSDPSASAYYT